MNHIENLNANLEKDEEVSSIDWTEREFTNCSE